MSTSYSIYRLSKPKVGEIEKIDFFPSFGSVRIKDADNEDTGEEIFLFRWDDQYLINIRDSRFSFELTLPEKETDYDSLFRSVGFSEDSIRNKKVHLVNGTGCFVNYSDGERIITVTHNDFERFGIIIQTHCFAVKMEELWNSDSGGFYPDHDRIRKYILDIDRLRFVPVNNQLLSRAEIPFLIFERNKGRCFIEKD